MRCATAVFLIVERINNCSIVLQPYITSCCDEVLPLSHSVTFPTFFKNAIKGPKQNAQVQLFPPRNYTFPFAKDSNKFASLIFYELCKHAAMTTCTLTFPQCCHRTKILSVSARLETVYPRSWIVCFCCFEAAHQSYWGGP